MDSTMKLAQLKRILLSRWLLTEFTVFCHNFLVYFQDPWKVQTGHGRMGILDENDPESSSRGALGAVDAWKTAHRIAVRGRRNEGRLCRRRPHGLTRQ